MSTVFDLRPGSRLGPYTLGPRLGEGAHASVHAARDASGREVAVKVRRAGSLQGRTLESELDRRFLREFESMRLLRIKGVAQVHEAGIDGNLLWFSMDRVDGRPFHEAFDGPVAGRVARARALGAELLRILATLHEAGFVHRDIKPTNVLVDAQDRVHVLDFGIGRYFGDHDTLSHTGEVLGTVPYMAPEQISGLPCDAKVDVFGAGLCLWEALGGKRPRPASAVGWIPRICLEPPASLATLSPEIPRGLAAVVDRLLRVDPNDRITARQAATELLASHADGECHEWPAPPWVDPGPAFHALESVFADDPEQPTTWVIEGPAGTGRGRLAEQLQRMGLLQGAWTLRARCRIQRVGAPFLELLELLSRALDDATLEQVVGPSAAALRRAWPHLVLPKAPEAATGGLVEAAADTVTALARTRPALVVVRDLEQVDPVTARILLALAERRPKDLGMVLIHETRWATPASTALVEALCERHGAGRHRTDRLSPSVAGAMVRALAPESTAAIDQPTTALQAAAIGWSALARWRGETFRAPDPALAVLVAGPRALPPPVFAALGGALGAPGVRVGDEGVSPAGETVRALLRAELADRRAAAAQIAATTEALLGDRPEVAPDLATTWLLAGDPDRAWAPAARAAVFEEQFERYAAAREWLLLLDTLPPSSRRDEGDDFDLAWVQARVALHADPEDDGVEKVALVERLARSEEQEYRVHLLRAEFDHRAGRTKRALVAALRIGSLAGLRPHLQVQALLVAFRCRTASRQIPEAQRDLDRAEAILGEHPDPVLQVRLSNARAELALLQDDLLWCRGLCQHNIRVASQNRHLHALAEASYRLGLVLRMLGRRREAEQHIRTAADAALATGDLRIRANAGLALAGLLCERGDALPARVLLDDTIRRIRALSLDHLLPTALRIALQIAIATGNATDGNVALSSIVEGPGDAETAAVLVQWWRTQGDLARASAIPAPSAGPRSYGHVRWMVEQARTRLASGDDAGASTLAAEVAARSTDLGFGELEVYARLVCGAAGAIEDGAWRSLQERAVTSMWCDVFLGAIEMDARRLHRASPALAAGQWRTLLVRARELGHQPAVDEATGWLGSA